MESVRIDRRNNMGLVRYFLALAVVVHHFNAIFGTGYIWPLSAYHAVGGFFALSGFLIYGSYMRSSSLKRYFEKRARKILPPYFFIVLACALLLYFTVDTCTGNDYFSWQWLKYVGANCVFLNFLCPTLPGVFADNAVPAVNASLWTMKIEWLLYASLPLAVWIVVKARWKMTWTAAVVILFSCCYRLWFRHLYEVTGNEVFLILSRQVFGQLSYFYCGILIYLNYERFIRYRWAVATVGVALIVGKDLIPFYAYFVEPLVLSVLVVWFSMVGKWGRWGGTDDNVSYEIYLFHWPVIQVLWQYREAIGLPDWGMLMLALTATAALACGCWFSFGKRILRGKFSKVK